MLECDGTGDGVLRADGGFDGSPWLFATVAVEASPCDASPSCGFFGRCWRFCV